MAYIFERDTEIVNLRNQLKERDDHIKALEEISTNLSIDFSVEKRRYNELRKKSDSLKAILNNMSLAAVFFFMCMYVSLF